MKQVEPEHYSSMGYDSKGRFCSYWHQINQILTASPQKTLEIGMGNGFVSNYIKERGFNIISLDVDRVLRPDVIGTILWLPFVSKSFDVVACYEVLEHLPFADFNKALSEIFRVSNSLAFLSIPDASRVYRFNVGVPFIGEIQRLIPSPRLRKPIFNFDGEHYWEIGRTGYPLKRVTDEIRHVGFDIIKTFRVFENPYHRFFILRRGSR